MFRISPRNTRPTRLSLTPAVALLAAVALISTFGRAQAPSALPLAEAKQIRGTVVDSGGRPMANLPVRLLQPGSMKVGGRGVKDPSKGPFGDSVIGVPAPQQYQDKGGANDKLLKTVNTDAQGAFVFTDIAPGEYKLSAGTGKTQVSQAITVADNANPDPVKLQLKK